MRQTANQLIFNSYVFSAGGGSDCMPSYQLKWLLLSWLLRKWKREFPGTNFEIGKPYQRLDQMLLMTEAFS